MARIDLEALARHYSDFELGPVTTHLEDGSFTVLLGPSGSGKSTLLRLLAGLETPDEGRIRFEARDVTRVPAERRGVGLVFQDGALFPHLTVAQNVAFGLRVQGLARAEREARVAHMLDLVGLGGRGDRRIARLSGGERQRVALARALAPQPGVLLLDEPLASLDRNLREELRGQIRRIHEELELTSVLVTHDRDEALALADHVLVLRDGRLVESGAPRRLFDEPSTAFTARFLGAANVMRRPDGEAVLVRPDALRLVPDAAGEAIVREVRFAGFHEEATVQTADGTTLEARAAVGVLPRTGVRVRIEFEDKNARRVASER